MCGSLCQNHDARYTEGGHANVPRPGRTHTHTRLIVTCDLTSHGLIGDVYLGTGESAVQQTEHTGDAVTGCVVCSDGGFS